MLWQNGYETNEAICDKDLFHVVRQDNEEMKYCFESLIIKNLMKFVEKNMTPTY